MLKIFKVLVTGIEGQEEIGLNSTVRTTMGYDQSAKEISVLIEKINLPEVPTDRSEELRDPHTTATFTTLLSKTFTSDDFPKTNDLMRWQVDYDVIKNELVIFDAFDYTQKLITDNVSGRKVARFVKQRYSADLIPLFALDNVYKTAPDFTSSILTVYTDEQGLDINDTILTGAMTTAETVTQQEKEMWLNININTNVKFEILDSEGKIISTQAANVKGSAKATTQYPQTNMAVAEEHPYATSDEHWGLGNQVKVSLPVADKYTIRTVYTRGLKSQRELTGTLFNITTVNAVCNKSRSVVSGRDGAAFDAFLEQRNTLGPENSTACGVDILTINMSDLSAGDYVKLKLNLGNYKSYAELWIELT
jgi:hypothetical protein